MNKWLFAYNDTILSFGLMVNSKFPEQILNKECWLFRRLELRTDQTKLMFHWYKTNWKNILKQNNNNNIKKSELKLMKKIHVKISC